MIIKKPYAFLIKHFKIIHLTLLALLIYILIKTTRIYNFFNAYINNDYLEYTEKFATVYINIIIFFVLVIIIIFAIILYFLMRKKQKSRKYYIFLGLFYTAVFFMLVYYFNVLTKLEFEPFTKADLRIIRDTSLLVVIPQYFFIAFALFRGLGFDLKNFTFDKKELEINETDNEEFELKLPIEGYELKRELRKSKKEWKYYFIENKAMLIIILVILLLIAGGVGLYQYQTKAKILRETQNFTINGLKYKVLSSVITTKNISGQEIDNSKQYIVVNFEVQNNLGVETELNVDKFRVINNGKSYLPITRYYDEFMDLGEGYKTQTLEANSTNDYILVFELSKSEKIKDTRFRIYEEDKKYRESTLNVSNQTSAKVMSESSLNEDVSLKEMLGNTSINISDVKVSETFNENYKYCVSNNCYVGSKIIKGDEVSSSKKAVVKLKVDINKDDDIYVNNSLKNNSQFLNAFVGVIYEKGDKKVYSKAWDITPEDLNNGYNYLEVNYDVLNSNYLDIAVTVRNNRYLINVK